MLNTKHIVRRKIMFTKRIVYFVFAAVFIVMLILSLLFTDVQLIAFDKAYYEKQYEKYKVPENIGIDMPNLMTATENMLNYLEEKRENLDFQMPIKGVQQEFFSERDKLHMVDVKNLFVQGRLIRNIAFWYCILFAAIICYKMKDRRKKFSKLFIYTFAAGIIPIIVLIILMNIDFYKYFTLFHEIFFNNDLWQLYPSKDRLINMYPEAFFSNIAFKIIFYYIGELTLLLALGIAGIYFKRRSLQQNRR